MTQIHVQSSPQVSDDGDLVVHIAGVLVGQFSGPRSSFGYIKLPAASTPSEIRSAIVQAVIKKCADNEITIASNQVIFWSGPE